MKRIPQSWLALAVALLCILNAGLGYYLIEQLRVSTQSQLETANKLALSASEVAQQRRVESILREKRACLLRADRLLPEGDAYIWMSKLLKARHPRMRFSIDPAESNPRPLFRDPDYGNSLLRVHGTATLPEVVSLLRTIEMEMPYAQVSDLLLQVTNVKGEQVNFTFSVLAILRLNEKAPDHDV